MRYLELNLGTSFYICEGEKGADIMIIEMLKTLGQLVVYCICFQIAFFLAIFTINVILNIVYMFFGGGVDE